MNGLTRCVRTIAGILRQGFSAASGVAWACPENVAAQRETEPRRPPAAPAETGTRTPGP